MSEAKDMKRMKIIKEVGSYADTCRSKTEELGNIAASAFGNKHKSQIKNLETIANSALKVSDVLDYIKRQTGRSKPDKEWKHQQLGVALLEIIEGQVHRHKDDICQKLTIADKVEQLDVALLLIREYIKQVVIHFEFKIGQEGE